MLADTLQAIRKAVASGGLELLPQLESTGHATGKGVLLSRWHPLQG